VLIKPMKTKLKVSLVVMGAEVSDRASAGAIMVAIQGVRRSV